MWRLTVVAAAVAMVSRAAELRRHYCECFPVFSLLLSTANIFSREHQNWLTDFHVRDREREVQRGQGT